MSTVNSTAASDVIARLQKNTAASTSKTTDAQSNFLKLLTEQLKNQDPLSPMDNAQMTSQLAQISTVDGIEKLNTTLTAMLSGSQSSEAVQAAALVGKGVMVEGSSLTLAGSKAYGGFELASGGRQGDRDDQGLQRSRGAQDGTGLLPRPASPTSRGTASHLQRRPGGRRQIHDERQRHPRRHRSVKPTALQLSTVNSVLRTSSGSVSLDVGSGNLVSLSDIKQIL
jgi:flagellar basal-body rod modification protein FlgD